MGVHKHNFSPAMHDYGVFRNNKRYSMQKKEIFVKLIYYIKTNLINSFFSKCLVKILRNSIKYVVLRVVSGAFSGALKVALLKVHSCRFENLRICSFSHKNNTLKISYSHS